MQNDTNETWHGCAFWRNGNCGYSAGHHHSENQQIAIGHTALHSGNYNFGPFGVVGYSAGTECNQKYKVGHSYTINGSQVFIGTQTNNNLNTNKTMENKKYVAPFDIGRYVRKGDILEISRLDEGCHERFPKEIGYRPQCVNGLAYDSRVPAEIVESFFKEYIEPKKLITIEDIVVGKTVLINKNNCEYLVIEKSNGLVVINLDYFDISDINRNFTIKQI